MRPIWCHLPGSILLSLASGLGRSGCWGLRRSGSAIFLVAPLLKVGLSSLTLCGRCLVVFFLCSYVRGILFSWLLFGPTAAVLARLIAWSHVGRKQLGYIVLLLSLGVPHIPHPPIILGNAEVVSSLAKTVRAHVINSPLVEHWQWLRRLGSASADTVDWVTRPQSSPAKSRDAGRFLTSLFRVFDCVFRAFYHILYMVDLSRRDSSPLGIQVTLKP